MAKAQGTQQERRVGSRLPQATTQPCSAAAWEELGVWTTEDRSSSSGRRGAPGPHPWRRHRTPRWPSRRSAPPGPAQAHVVCAGSDEQPRIAQHAQRCAWAGSGPPSLPHQRHRRRPSPRTGPCRRPSSPRTSQRGFSMPPRLVDRTPVSSSSLDKLKSETWRADAGRGGTGWGGCMRGKAASSRAGKHPAVPHSQSASARAGSPAAAAAGLALTRQAPSTSRFGDLRSLRSRTGGWRPGRFEPHIGRSGRRAAPPLQPPSVLFPASPRCQRPQLPRCRTCG